MILRSALVLLLAGGTTAAAAQTIELRDAGPGEYPAALRLALGGPHVAVLPGSSPYVVGKDSVVGRTLVVVGRHVTVDGTVHGDLFVVGADVYLHPGARIDGRVISIGGGAYESSLQAVGGGVVSIRDFAYHVSYTPAGIALTYRDLPQPPPADRFSLAGLQGFGIPSYDRTNGLSFPVGAVVAFDDGRLTLQPWLTYRSQLGRIDPSIMVIDTIRHGVFLSAGVGRSTYSNDRWIRADLINSLITLTSGDDTRNYFRATRGEAKINWESDSAAVRSNMYFGIRGEHALTARPGQGAGSGPWSLFGRHDLDDMLRPNPSVDNGVTMSGIGGGEAQWELPDIVAHARLEVEVGRTKLDEATGTAAPRQRTFGQVTFDGAISFPTFGPQRIRFAGHAVVTSHGQTPRQRWAYIGGTGTLPPFDRLEFGGDQLVYLDGRYIIPITRFELPLVGSPTITLRHAIGGAAVDEFPDLHQSLSVRASLGPAYIDYAIDPASDRKHTSFGLSVIR